MVNFEERLATIANVLSGYDKISRQNYLNICNQYKIGVALNCDKEILERLRNILLNIEVIAFAKDTKNEVAMIKDELTLKKAR